MKNPIVSIDKSGKIPVYIVKKIFPDEELINHVGKFIEEKEIHTILQSNADVYTEDGDLLLRFRKNVLPQKHVEDAYEALKMFIKNYSTNRGVASGSDKGLKTGQKIPVMSNIIGYFDGWSISQRYLFKQSGIKKPTNCRITKFTGFHHDKWEKVIPLIEDIDKQYKKLCPKEYKSQWNAGQTTPYRIANTAFSTVTTNLNFRTAAHYDKGDWMEGFGNLVVIEKGSPYKGAYTCFPQYGVGVDCRTGDFLAMDVHRLHGNLPLIREDETSQRLSLVCYLREGIVKKCEKDKLYDPIKLFNKVREGIASKKNGRQIDKERMDADDRIKHSLKLNKYIKVD